MNWDRPQFFLGRGSVSAGLFDWGTGSPRFRILGALERSILESVELDEVEAFEAVSLVFKIFLRALEGSLVPNSEGAGGTWT